MSDTSSYVRSSCLLACRAIAILSLACLACEFATAQEKPEDAAATGQPAAVEKAAEGKEEAKSDESPKESAKPAPKKQVRVLALSGTYEDLPSVGGLNPTNLLLGSGTGKPKAFYKLCDHLDEISHEELVTHVVFDLSASGLSMNSAQLDELTRRLQHLRSHGKKCIAWLESAGNVHLAVAAACDEVLLADLGGIDMPSSSMETMFYRDAMDLLGIKASVTRAGDFKGAVEPYLNSTMSKHLKEHYLAMLESINNAQVTRIAKGRGLPAGAVRDLQKKRMILPAEALANRLVDRLVPYGAMKKTILDGLGENYEWTTPKTKPKREVSIFELLGKAMAPPKDPSKLKDNSIVVIHLSGAIEDGKTASPGSIVSGPTVKLIEDLAADDKVKGVVVRINSPGGSATASEAIRQALDGLAKKKPLVFSMGEMAASGGYWITCIGQPIFAEHGTITGSIGVFSLKVSAGTLMRRVGVHVESVTLDSAAGMDALNHAWTEEEIDAMQGFIDTIYNKFLQIASTSRNIPVDTLKSLAGGRVWSGEQAKANRLVDQLGGLDDAIAMVAKGAKLDKYKVVHRPEANAGLDLAQLLGGQDDEVDIALSELGGHSANAASQGRWLAMLETKLLTLLQEQGFRSDSTRLLFRSIDWTGKQPPKAWALLGEELKISH
ncbi:MAG: signal peptide peptidase SppA [Planctomycetota bacterium]|jgi:protease-4